MEMRKCLKGHYYDASIYSTCPYCENNVENGVTVGLGYTSPAQSGDDDDSRTLPIGYQSAAQPQPQAQATPNTPAVADDDDDGRTVAIIHQDLGIDPVVGWLICINNKEKGRDYRVHADNNYIGRSEKMDICIRGDETISRENHAIISYDSVDGTFYFSPGDGRSIVRLNDKAIFQTVEIAAYDTVTIGKTKLLFIPLCGEKFDWSDVE